MLQVTSLREPPGDVVDVRLSQPEQWNELMPGRGRLKMAIALFGDEQCGPFAAFYSDLRRTEPMPMSPGHGHGSDSWRISLKGTLRVGAKRYSEASFRFQEGGILYGPDDVSWGPEGGRSVVMMADRRGRGAIATRPEDQAAFNAASASSSTRLGIAFHPDFSELQQVATTLGQPHNGRIDGSFADDWPELVPGVTYAAGLVGDPAAGPLILMTKTAPHGVAVPAIRFDADVMHIVVAGDATQGSSAIAEHDVRIIAGNRDSPPIKTGSEALWLATVIGDRRAVAGATSDQVGSAWLDRLKAISRDLDPSAAPDDGASMPPN